MIGQKFERLTVIERSGSDKHKKALWLCKCDCGNETKAVTQQLRAGKKRSCGCLKLEGTKKRWAEYREGNKPFWDKVKKTIYCWEWVGGKDTGGYGQIGCADGTRYKAHRKSWLIHSGEIPEGMMVLHKCDNPACVNPEHLFLGTHADNMRDMAEKGRREGKQIFNRKILTDDEVFKVKKLLNDGFSQSEVARMFEVTPGCINHIACGRRK